MITRRKLLITGGSAIAVGGLLGANLLHSDLSIARAPWRDVGQAYDDPRLSALAYAILAPSPHNRQPWLIELEGASALTLYADTDRFLPETDPPNRQITIGLGAFLELLIMAAPTTGHKTETVLFPDGEPGMGLDKRPIARVTFTPNQNTNIDPLFAHVLTRRTNRQPFDLDKPVTSEALKQLHTAMGQESALFEHTTDKNKLSTLRSICKSAWEVEITTPRTHKESTRLTRVGEKQINANPDGISLSGPLMEGLKVAGMMAPETMNNPTSTAFKGTRDFYNGLIDTAMAFAWLNSPDNSRISQINAGAHWLRLNLAATQAGLAFHPLSQALQEFPEMTEQYTKIHQELGVRTPSRIQGLFRLGYAKSSSPSPRWPLKTRLIDAP